MAPIRRGGRLFIISAPSGSGKTTLCKRLLKDNSSLVPSISATTRSPRPGETDGIDYHFISKGDFERMAAGKEFLEYEENFGNLYGTPKRFIEDSLEKGRPILLSIDVKGAMKVKRAYPKESVMIFILPPSLKALRQRLKRRQAAGAKTISDRSKPAKNEMARKERYDYQIVNDRLTSAYKKLKAIIIKETEN